MCVFIVYQSLVLWCREQFYMVMGRLGCTNPRMELTGLNHSHLRNHRNMCLLKGQVNLGIDVTTNFIFPSESRDDLSANTSMAFRVTSRTDNQQTIVIIILWHRGDSFSLNF